MKYSVILLALLVASCAKKSGNIKNGEEGFYLPDSLYTIITFNPEWTWMFTNVFPTNLSQNELSKIEYIIGRAVRENDELQSLEKAVRNNESAENQEKEGGFELATDNYHRQYVPVINQYGQKEIWVNFFCGDLHSSQWKSGLVMVKDGGRCYFNLKINLQSETYSELRINGEA
ncbi:MAG: hypothetical protein GC181_10405 [Bacteroidetes bacterium]|nr:hypothetical protein [Bacteroidota bacterium]